MSENINKPLSDFEKEQLKHRILCSATNLRKRRKRVRQTQFICAAAACALLLFGLFHFLDRSQEPSIENFITNAPVLPIEKDGEVTVVLSNGNSVHLTDENGTVRYSTTGNVQIGSDGSFQQEVPKDEKPIFNTILVPYGKRTSVTLSDGTRVWINSGSKIVFPAVFLENERVVYLEGEAIFDVAHNAQKPFKVISGNQEIEVLGTVFNVSGYPEDQAIYTILKSGSVKLTYNKEKANSFKIAPGTLASYNSKTGKVETKQVNVDEYLSWREGLLSLKNHTLGSIATKLSRYYNVNIVIQDEQLNDETFSGKLDLKDDVGNVIDIIREATHFSVEHENETIILTKKH